jgi:AcrR family transcriptional regulator
MGIQERKIRQRQNLRQEILDAARELFAREGYENVTMRRVAEEIEYSPTTIYLHFKDKAELVHQVCEQTFAQLGDSIERIAGEAADPVEALRNGLRAYIEFGIAHPGHYRVNFMTPIEHPEMDRDEYFRTSQGGRAFNYLREAVHACIQTGRFASKDAELTSQVLWAGAHGLTSLLIVQRDFPWVDRNALISRMLDVLISGLEAR